MPQGPAVPYSSFQGRQWPSFTTIIRALAITLIVVAAVSCSRARKYPLQGQIVAIDIARGEMTVDHGDIRGFMPAMTMPFKVRDPGSLKARKPGDLIRATLVIEDSYGILEDIHHTGTKPLPAGTETPTLPSVLPPGHPVTDAAFVDQGGKSRRLADWRGRTVAVTFIYTRCPLPDFCPLMDRHFASVQKTVESDPQLRDKVHLLSVSFDPGYDTPAMLRAHAKKAGAHEAWTFLTGSAGDIDKFAQQFGVTIMRPGKPLDEITHNLRTAVIDGEGRLVKIFDGNDWKPEELIDAFRAQHGR